MNMTYSEEMRPPKELFSRQWGYIIVNEPHSRPPLYGRIDETKKKLENLETKLRKKIDKLRKKIDWRDIDCTGDLLVDTVTLLSTYIGVWEIRWRIMISTPSSWETQKIYPIPYTPSRRKIVGEDMSKVVLGDVEREGVYLVMLSPQCVEWLNMISDWVGE